MDYVGSVHYPTSGVPKVSQPHVIHQRIQSIQSYLQKVKADGLLIANGTDSKYSTDCRKLTFFLLGYSTSYKNTSHTDVKDVDETLFLIQQQKVHVYLHPNLYNALYHLICHIKNLVLHCLDSTLQHEQDTVEDHKVYSFIQMLKDVKTLAVPYSSKESFNYMNIEKWPLFQAYALDEYGGRGFFTAQNQIIPLNYTTQDFYNVMDSSFLHELLHDISSHFSYQWDIFTKKLYRMISEKDYENVSSVFESIRSYASHGSGIKGTTDFTPIFHPKTNSLLYVCCGVSGPRNLFHVGRTYFNFDGGTSPDLEMLASVYDAMVHSAHRTIQRYVTSRNAAKLSVYFGRKFADRITASPDKATKKLPLKKLHITVTLEHFNTRGDRVSSSYSPGLIQKFAVAIRDIPSVEVPGYTFGKITFTETFLDSHLSIRDSDDNDDVDVDSEYLLVTEIFPVYVQVYPVTKVSSASTTIPCTLFTTTSNDFYQAHLEMRDEGGAGASYLTIISEYTAPLTLPLADIRSVSVKRSGNISVLLYMDHVVKCAPPFTKRLALAFWQRGKGNKFCLETLLPALQSLGLEVASPDTIPSNLVRLFENYISRKMGGGEGGEGRTGDPHHQLFSRFPTFKTFLSHFKLTSLGKYQYPHADIHGNTETEDEGDETKPQLIHVTVMLGIPGSHQEQVALAIARDRGCVVLKEPLPSSTSFSPSHLQASLEEVAHKNVHGAHVLVVVSGHVEPVTVVTAILHHPRVETRKRIRLGTVNTCINAAHVFLCNQTPFPKLTEQLTEGWINNIIVTSGLHKGKDAVIAFIKKLAPYTRIITIRNARAAALEPDDIDAICGSDSFNDRDLALARHLSTPGWFYGLYHESPPYLDVNSVTLTFQGLLPKSRLLLQLKKLHQKEGRVFLDRLVVTGSIFFLRLVVQLSDDNMFYDMTCVPRNDSITIVPVDEVNSPPVNTLVCVGHCLTEAQVRAWVAGCAPKCPSKKDLLTEASLNEADHAELHKRELELPLPKGWYYNGSYYVEMSGAKSTRHPEYAKILEAFLDRRNKAVIEFNRDVDNFVEPILF